MTYRILSLAPCRCCSGIFRACWGASSSALAEMAPCLSVVDEYAGVSNTNMHIRAGIGRAARVLVPFPPEFRWMHCGDTSPWFPGFRLYRQGVRGNWADALSSLAEN